MQILSEEEKSSMASRHRLESELIILQSDKKKLERKEEDLVLEIRHLGDDVKRFEIMLHEKQAAKQRLNTELTMMDAEITHLKKRINIS